MFKNGDVLGNTPMIKINYKFRGKMNYVYVKLEYFSLTGSIKDRVAYYMINNAKKRGELKERNANNRSYKWKYRNSISSFRKLL